MIEPKPHRKPLPLINEETPAIKVRDGWRPEAGALAEAPLLDDWRIYGKRITGCIDGGDLKTVNGLVAKLYIRGGWVLMDDQTLFRLGLRSYPGT